MKNNIQKISIIVLIFTLLQSCSIIGLIQSEKKILGDFKTELKPENYEGYYDMSINVVQGIASFENGFFTSQTSANKFLSINFLDENGNSLFNKRFDVVSHGQDLSLEKISENELYLYTTLGHFNEEGASGILRFKVILPDLVDGKRNMYDMDISMDTEIYLELDNCTPTISEDKKSFAMRTGNSIIVAKKQDVLKADLSKAKTFYLDETQLSDKDGNTLWFQGIAMKNNKIYCMTGNNSIDSPKYLYVYSVDGTVLEKHNIDQNDFCKKIGHKYEPEGITFIGDDLYYTIMAKGETGGNRKFLFKLN